MNLDCRHSSQAFEAKRWGLNFLLQDEVIITQKTVKILPLHDISIFRCGNLTVPLLDGGVASLLIFWHKTDGDICKKYVNLTCYKGEICVMYHGAFNWGLVNLHYKLTPVEGNLSQVRITSSPFSWKLLPDKQTLITNCNWTFLLAFKKGKETMHGNWLALSP